MRFKGPFGEDIRVWRRSDEIFIDCDNDRVTLSLVTANWVIAALAKELSDFDHEWFDAPQMPEIDG